jgi:hypothetical protein
MTIWPGAIVNLQARLPVIRDVNRLGFVGPVVGAVLAAEQAKSECGLIYSVTAA